MKVFSILICSSCLPLAAQAPASPTPQPEPRPLVEKAAGCDAKGCPRLDQNGQAPTSCAYESSLATGFNCILLCTYPNSQWGTVVASSSCD